MPLLVVAGLVLVATTATVTWLLANPEVESKASVEAAVSKDETVEDKSAPPPPRPPDGDMPQGTAIDVTADADRHVENSSGGLAGTGEDDVEVGEGSDAGGETTGGEPPGTDGTVTEEDAPATAADGEDTNETVTADTKEQPSQPPPTPTMTIRVARKGIGPLWVWVGRLGPYYIGEPPYKVIRKVPEGSYVYWNTMKRKAGGSKQKVGKRKKKKIWNLVITLSGTNDLYLDE